MKSCSAISNTFILPDTISTSPLNFGTVTSVGLQHASSNLLAECTPDAPYTAALDGGTISDDINDRKMQLGPAPIDYQLYRNATRTQVWIDTAGSTVGGAGSDVPQSIPVFGRVPAQGAKPEGSYQDAITATLTF